MELPRAFSVHWVEKRDNLTDGDEIANAVWAWGDTKRKFTRELLTSRSTAWNSSTGWLAAN